ncbi:hypothetical protein [Pseudonocardia sp.]|uniref:DivIVA domain-containing protein n=1 Tax=Pseudonocardia sp. TaxID=60912 RepID=UPI003D11D09F
MADDHAGLEMGDLTSPATAYGSVEGEFQVVRRGYDQRQVDSHLDRLDAEIRILLADRNAAVEQAAQLGRELDESRARAERLRVQVRALVSPPTSLPGMSERMRSMLRLAEDEVSEMLTQADAEAIRRRHDAELEAGEIRSAALAGAERSAAEDAKRRAECDAEIAAAAADMAAHRRAFEAELERERRACSARISHAEEDARTRIADEQAAWEARRALIEEDFLRAMDQRRAEALAELERNRIEIYRRNTDMIAAAQEQSARTISAADDHAARTVAEATARVTELADARERVAAQLAQARAALAHVLGGLSATPERDVPSPAPEVTEQVAAPTEAGASSAGAEVAYGPAAAAVKVEPAGAPAPPTPNAAAAEATAPREAEPATSPAGAPARPSPTAAPRAPEPAETLPSGTAVVVPLSRTDGQPSPNGAHSNGAHSNGTAPDDSRTDGRGDAAAITALPAEDGFGPTGEGPKPVSAADAGHRDTTPVRGTASARRRTRRPSPPRS